MSQLPTALARLAGLRKMIAARIENPAARYFDPDEVLNYFRSYQGILSILKAELTDLFGDLPDRPLPVSSSTSDYEGRGYIQREQLERLLRDIDYVFEVRSHSELAPPVVPRAAKRVFLSHGRAADWREVQAFVEREVDLRTLELAQEPNRGRTILEKLEQESARCWFAVIVMTGDDEVAKGPPRARENVIHEIGYFQGKYGVANVCLLHEEGTNIPSNIHGLVYIPFPKDLVSAAFGALGRELRDAAARRD